MDGSHPVQVNTGIHLRHVAEAATGPDHIDTMNHTRLLLSAAALGLIAGSKLRKKQLGKAIAAPKKSVDLQRYLGLWYEIGRFENRFEHGCEAATATYTLRRNGTVKVINSCRDNSLEGPLRTVTGTARIVAGSANARLKVSFFRPFYSDYWILDHDDAYEWSIVGEPTGRYLWLLHRQPQPSADRVLMLMNRAGELGYDPSCIRQTRQPA